MTAVASSGINGQVDFLMATDIPPSGQLGGIGPGWVQPAARGADRGLS